MATKYWQLSIRIPTTMHQRWLKRIEKSERYKTVSAYVLDNMEKLPVMEAENAAMKKELIQLRKDNHKMQQTTIDALQAIVDINNKIP